MNRAAPFLAKLSLLMMFLGAIALARWVGASTVAAAPVPATTAETPFYATKFEHRPDPKTLTALGRALFSDRTLSASGRMSCASCHDPAHAYGPANHLAVQLGGPDQTLPGLRAVPSLKYHQTIPPFSERFFDNDGNDGEDQGPTGGFDWDGRADSVHEQAAGPLLSPFEMANAGKDEAVARLQASPNAKAMRAAFGDHLFDDPRRAWNALVLALEVFQQSPRDFYPYDSKYDAFLRGKAKLSPQEMRGLAVFNDAGKGNCASCHLSTVKRGAFPQFTDAGLIAIGVPRNRAIPANANADFRDLGACGPLRTDLKGQDKFCGLFRTPSLRNVALRGVYFHNGVYTRLEDAVRFYALRDADPARVYGKGHRHDDLPQAYDGNLNVAAPFGDKPGAKPRLTEAEIADVVAFLGTLTDGWIAPDDAKVAQAR
ncbi:MAG TPA: cytochrome c peroxidase [Burkholderiaceae bacterium]